MPAEPTNRQLITLDQAAEYIGTSRQTVRRMIARGDLTGYRLPGRSRGLRVDFNELAAALQPVAAAS